MCLAFGVVCLVFGVVYLVFGVVYLVPRGCIYHVRGVYPVAFVGGWLGCVSQFPKVQI